MRYSTEYKELARVNLLTAMGSHAKQHGFSSSGMADLAAAAGVTTGSVYKHFNGKSDLFAAMIAAELKRTADHYSAVDANDPKKVSRALASYLNLSHVEHASTGCPLPALTAEIGRADVTVKAAFEQGVRDIHANVTSLTGDENTAWAMIAQNVGAVMLARAMPNETLRLELMQAVRRAGEKMLSGD